MSRERPLHWLVVCVHDEHTLLSSGPIALFGVAHVAHGTLRLRSPSGQEISMSVGCVNAQLLARVLLRKLWRARPVPWIV